MRKIKKESLILGQILKKIAPLIGATVLIEPKWGIVGQITFRGGRRSYFRYNTVDLNPVGAADVARDKDYASFFMKSLGYPVVADSKTFFSDRWGKAIGAPRQNIDAAYKYAKKLGLPVIVKPNSGSQGVAVALVHNKREFYRSFRNALKRDKVILVQRPIKGQDYRLVVLDQKVVSGYKRVPLNVVGDGKSTVLGLLKAKQRQFVASSRDTRIDLTDPRMADKLKHQGLSFRSIPLAGSRIYLLDNANLSTGGDSVDVTEAIHPLFKKMAIRLTKEMGLRLCGVDLIVDGQITEKPNPGHWLVLEINAAPGLDHYVKIGRKQKLIVENLYLEVLKSLNER